MASESESAQCRSSSNKRSGDRDEQSSRARRAERKRFDRWGSPLRDSALEPEDPWTTSAPRLAKSWSAKRKA